MKLKLFIITVFITFTISFYHKNNVEDKSLYQEEVVTVCSDESYSNARNTLKNDDRFVNVYFANQYDKKQTIHKVFGFGVANHSIYETKEIIKTHEYCVVGVGVKYSAEKE